MKYTRSTAISTDIDFLCEMKELWEKCNEKMDRPSFEMLGKMIDDWLEELKEERSGK